MKPTTHEWLTRAAEDLAAAQLLLSRPDLTNLVAFHAQQVVEKALKAVIEELNLGFVRTHSLTRLYELVRPHYPIVSDMDMLDRLDAVYIEARYPGDMGLLPTGKPTQMKPLACLALLTTSSNDFVLAYKVRFLNP